ESGPLALLRGVGLDPDEPLDDVRRDDDRPDRNVPARAVHRPRHLGALLELPRPEGAPGSRLLPEQRDPAAGDGCPEEAPERPAREAGDLRLEGAGPGEDEEDLSAALQGQAAREPSPRLVHGRAAEAPGYAAARQGRAGCGLVGGRRGEVG